MKSLIVGLMVIVIAASSIGAQTADTKTKLDSRPKAEHAVMELESERLRAYQTGDKAAFDRIAAEGFTMTHSDGSIFDREQEMDIIKPAPPGQPYPALTTENVQLNVYENTAVLTGLLVEKESNAARPQTLRLRFTNTYVKRRGRWQMLAGHLTRLPQTRAAIKADAATYDAYAGRYETVPDRVITVFKEANKLMAQIGDRQVELLPEFANQFFLESSDTQIFFVKDAGGQVSHFVSRRPSGEMVLARKIN